MYMKCLDLHEETFRRHTCVRKTLIMYETYTAKWALGKIYWSPSSFFSLEICKMVVQDFLHILCGKSKYRTPSYVNTENCTLNLGALNSTNFEKDKIGLCHALICLLHMGSPFHF